jgi:hypothetical protein
MKEKITTIRISERTKQKLDDVGKKGETYEDIILKLLKGGSK